MSQPSLKSLIAQVLGVESASLSDDSGMNKTEGWDSLRQFLIVTEIEQTLGAKFTIEQMERTHSLGELRAILSAQGIQTSD